MNPFGNFCFLDRYRNDFYAQRTKKQTWIESFIECSPTFLARHSQIPYDTPLDINGSYWLSNTRRFMTHDSVRKGMLYVIWKSNNLLTIYQRL